MVKHNKNKRGFTIIEVVLVLAIAGLIFLMVFVVFPQVQRNQKDTQRKDDLSRFFTAVVNYQSNNRNKLPFGEDADMSTNTELATNSGFIQDYLKKGGDTFEDPSTGDYKVVYVGSCTASSCQIPQSEAEGTIYIYTNAKCDGETPKYEEGKRNFAATIKLEGANRYCENN